MLDKRDLINHILSHYKEESIEIELGCGQRKRNPKSIGIDKLDYPCVDIVGDINEILTSIPENSISTITSFHVLEHLDDIAGTVQRLENILKDGGKLQIVVPHFSNPHYYSDYTHKHFFGLYSLSYLSKDDLFHRQVPTYGTSSNLVLTDVQLLFKSSPPFYLKHALKAIISKIFNSSRYFQETYEELLCWLVPCYEIDYRLTKCSPSSIEPADCYKRGKDCRFGDENR